MFLKATLNHNHYYGAKLVKELYATERSNHRKTLVKHVDKNRTYIIFKGTSNRGEWRHNLNIRINDNHVHSGFNEYAHECKKELDLMDIFSKAKNRDIYICSHSLGASASLILLYEMYLFHKHIFNRLKSLDIVLYGCPKTGDRIFIERLKGLLQLNANIHIYRYVVQNDIVTNYPPTKEYEHIEDMLLLKDDEKNIYDSHFIDSYIYNLNKQNLDKQ